MRSNVSVGSYAVDSEAAFPDLMVVVNRPGVEAQDWDTRRGDSTVAADNPDYPVDSSVLVVVFLSDLEEWCSDWEDSDVTDFSLEALAGDSVPFYAFPANRLEEPSKELLQEAIDPTPETAELLQLLQDGGIDCELDDAQTIVCTKFGETYRVRPGELVSGSGVLAERLESLAIQVS